MNWAALSFLAEPWFVIPWYIVGALGAAWVTYDVKSHNKALKQAMKWAWPIVVLFFSAIGLALYVTTARAPDIADKTEAEAEHAHAKYERNEFRRVNGAVIHCVAGDGLGIMSGMVIARALGMSFWQEFWLEYAVGFAFGWFIFQFKSMTMMTDSKAKALSMAFRAEFFSMLTVMAGMGAVMTYVTPMVVSAQPKPLTYAFWGFGMLGLLVGYVFTFPMNWLMLKVGWKHGMGRAEDARPVQTKSLQSGLIGAICALGAIALAVPAALAELREGTPLAPTSASSPTGQELAGPATALNALARGLEESLTVAARGLQSKRREQAAHALDAALRSAEVAHAAVPQPGFASVLDAVKKSRHALQMGDEARSYRQIENATRLLRRVGPASPSSPPTLAGFAGATAINAQGVRIGEVVDSGTGQLSIALGGPRDVFGFWDIRKRGLLHVSADSVVFGPKRVIGETLVALPSHETDRVSLR